MASQVSARRGDDEEDGVEASFGRAGSCLSWKEDEVRDEVLAVPTTAAEVEAGLCWALVLDFDWAASSGLPLLVVYEVV